LCASSRCHSNCTLPAYHGGLAQTPAFWSLSPWAFGPRKLMKIAFSTLRCPAGTGLCCPLSPVDPCGARARHSGKNTASLTTADPQANSPARA
jgi:hypothetical protein